MTYRVSQGPRSSRGPAPAQVPVRIGRRDHTSAVDHAFAMSAEGRGMGSGLPPTLSRNLLASSRMRLTGLHSAKTIGTCQ